MFEKVEECPICKGKEFKNVEIAQDFLQSGESFVITECSKCRLLVTNPRPTKESIVKYYESDRYLSHQTEKGGLFTWIYKVIRAINIRSKFRMISSKKKSGHILDYGCGTGQFLSYCKKQGWEVSGVEPNSKASSKAKEQGLDVSPQINAADSTIYDIITLWHVLEHIHDISSLMQQLKKTLAPNGRIYVAVPNPSSKDCEIYGNKWAGWDVPRHLYHFRKKDIDALAKNHGFKLEAVIPMMWDAYYVSLLSEENITGKKNWIKSLINGYKSNTYGKKTGIYSSSIYILKHAKK
jgi:2-polyprenyl-3-methyl-5-hydroxy-6-metoxy-1,4-benzoquinol methylase